MPSLKRQHGRRKQFQAKQNDYRPAALPLSRGPKSSCSFYSPKHIADEAYTCREALTLLLTHGLCTSSCDNLHSDGSTKSGKKKKLKLKEGRQ